MLPLDSIKRELQRHSDAFNTAFSCHRRFPLNATERLAEGVRTSIYSGTAEQWTVALHVTLAHGVLNHELVLADTLPPRMRAHLEREAEKFEQQLRDTASGIEPHNP